MARSICIICGHEKKAPWQKCHECGFTPEDEVAFVKSVFLSTARFSDEDEADQERYAKELDVLGKRIQQGERITYDEKELDRLREERELYRSVPLSAVYGALFRFFLPGILLVAVLFAMLYVFRLPGILVVALLFTMLCLFRACR